MNEMLLLLLLLVTHFVVVGNLTWEMLSTNTFFVAREHF
jgi:hypothetical protein